MFLRRHATILVSACTLSAALAASAAESIATHAVVDDAGTRLASSAAPTSSSPAATRGATTPAIAGPTTILWTRNTGTAIVANAGLSLDAGVASATTLNAPREVALAALEGDGTPIWQAVGSDYRAAAAAHADVIAGVDLVGDHLLVHKWTSAGGTPDWTDTVAGATLASFRTVVVSDDGSTIAVLASLASGGARMLVYDASSPTPLATYDALDGATGRNVEITSDGRFIAFRVSAWAYVFERDALALRDAFSTGASTDPITISDDGQFIAFGFTNVQVRSWNGAGYAPLWARTPPSSILRHCAISADGSTLATAWSSFAGTSPFVEMHDLASSTPDWTHHSPTSEGSLQDIPSALDLTPDGGFLAVSFWGNAENDSPQIQLFARDAPDPVVQVTTPGSMFDVSVARTAGGVVYVAAGGKHVHANINGNGGDVFAIRYGTTPSCPEDLDGSGAVDFADLLAVLSAWGPCGGCPEDLDGNGAVEFADVLAVLSSWGPC